MKVAFEFQTTTVGGSDKSYHYQTIKHARRPDRNVAIFAQALTGMVIVGVSKGKATVKGVEHQPSGYGRPEVLQQLHLFSLSGNRKAAGNYIWYVLTPKEFEQFELHEYIPQIVEQSQPKSEVAAIQPIVSLQPQVAEVQPVVQTDLLQQLLEENKQYKTRLEELEKLTSQLTSKPRRQAMKK